VSRLLRLYADVTGAFRECTSYSEISLQHTSLCVCFINELCIYERYMFQVICVLLFCAVLH
jgi:hypothetical protein